ncbi:MAG: Na+/H+ antiporter NhaC family protein [Bacteroidota bacterium]
MEHYGFWSVLPPVIAIALAIRTKQVFIALVIGIWLGWVIINQGNLLEGTFATIQAMVDVFKDDGNTRTIIFTLLVGALIAYIQRSGGVNGFINKLDQLLKRLESGKWGNNRLFVQVMAACTGLIIFVESNISVLTVGTLYRPVTDRLKIPREKLAYLADSTSAPSSILIPFNAWGAYIMGLLVIQNFEKPFQTLMGAFPYNFYPFLAVILVFYFIFSGKDYGPMKKAEIRAREEGKVINDDAIPMVSDEVTVLDAKAGVPIRARNMIIPIATMVLMMPIMLVYTGWSAESETSGMGRIFEAIGQGSGSASVLYSVITALLVSAAMYMIQKIMTGKELIDLTLKGMSGMISLALLMVMAFAIGSLCKNLGTGIYVAEVSKAWLSPGLVPAIVFIVSCFIAFSTGTSWGTFAIMISIAVPMAQSFDTNVSLAIAAALGGGVFGDHCSPISDTTIISSMASASDHIDHVKTQLPYALVAGSATLVLYLILGFLL